MCEIRSIMIHTRERERSRLCEPARLTHRIYIGSLAAHENHEIHEIGGAKNTNTQHTIARHTITLRMASLCYEIGCIEVFVATMYSRNVHSIGG